ncbi:hypothetical protein [Comamonas squillarum]|uniref:Uncharacterized protein n=1 Tax=Comamonas squillarum TaxID=2977320 RepID=A0ABY5ZXG3_9BURK|nr:hypothetical protein [Comamonas sp. PR12]UXC17447.1 hypothetical protein N4T19_17320 [Comamonas sp. PR12]
MTSNSQPKIPQQDPSVAGEEVRYELDDGPLNKAQVQAIQKLADEQAFTGATIRKTSLLPIEL